MFLKKGFRTLLSLFVAGKNFLAVSGNFITDGFARNNSFCKKDK
jgi:hypothetical protein